MILTNNGLVEIEKIKTGDSVWSYNIESGKTELNPVQNIFERKTDEFIKLYFAKDSVICTFEHPFFVINDWKAAKDLKQVDSLFAYAGYKVALDSIYTFRSDTATAVYNLEAGGNHNYYVSASGVLVHNKPWQVGKIVTRISNSQINKLIQKGVKVVERVDYIKLGKFEKPHIHFEGGSAVNIDGTFKHLGKSLTKSQKQFLESIGWGVPK